MKKTAAFFLSLLWVAAIAMAQNPNCAGLKNPTNFTLTGGIANSQWTGYIGTKPCTASTCSVMGATLGSAIAASQLSSQTSSSGCAGNTVDINGQADQGKRFSIKGTGTDPMTLNNLSSQGGGGDHLP